MRLRSPLLVALVMVPLAARGDVMRAAVGRPLQRAEALIQARNFTAALAEIGKANAVPGQTPDEHGAIAQLHGAAEAGAGNYAQAAADYQAVLAAGPQPKAQQLALTQAVADLFFEAADYPKSVSWVNRYIAAGGADTRTRALLPQAYLEEGDAAAAEAAAWRDERDEHGGAPPAELRLLAYSAQKAGDRAGYISALLAELRSAPDAATWNAAISTVVARPDFPDALTLDAYRLRRATGTLTAPGDLEDYAERAILAGQPAEARAVIDQGFAAGVLDQTTDGGHASRLKTLTDANPAPVNSVPVQDPLQQGILAYQIGQHTQAVAAFNKVAATASGAGSDLARLWAIRAAVAAPIAPAHAGAS